MRGRVGRAAGSARHAGIRQHPGERGHSARSGQDIRGFGYGGRSPATSCRSAGTSASFDAADCANRASQENT